YLLRYVDDPPATVRELARVVRPGGTIAMLEFAVPRGAWRVAWELWVRVGLPAAGRVISPGWHEVGRFLGPSIRTFWRRHDPAAFALGMGVGAHALDELHGRPLRTNIPDAALWTLAAVSIAAATAVGVYACVAWTWLLAPFVVAGAFIVVAYNLELFAGAFHST